MGNLSTPIRVQKLQTALHAKVKAEAGYRFYALYDKIYREDVLAHAYAQCRSNKGAPGVDRQDFAEVEAHGVQKWLGELALAIDWRVHRGLLAAPSEARLSTTAQPASGARLAVRLPTLSLV
ncbi:hypothetical protein B0G75_12837 [Paraburkholderia sp. BL18I3N2]|uniref:hypothetical protein n=1 Tax=unclassified Paraburkholderia TaxID=2615204 RepID=UPI000D483F9D|nr:MULTISPECIES: hypothetical protein [unclassified Paraburkholderia]PRX22342.1 hypothetical protein B0G75_12837 [Paraburkholderia sp. BL18I3N2]PRX89428.1 hypothetical protein B0G73_1472 [Paraburkholderia sp. BL25I1N1]